jgi:hypothetical protein
LIKPGISPDGDDDTRRRKEENGSPNTSSIVRTGVS